MKNKYFIFTTFLTALALSLASCDDYLDLAPDNRAEVDTKDMVASLLVSGYPTHVFNIISEMASDNMDHRILPANLSYNYKSQEDAYLWGPSIDETGNDSPKDVWESFYGCIAVANQALQSIEDMGNTAELQPQRGEALMIRAYCHLILVNLFCLHYNEATSSSDMGIPYMEAPETKLNPYYERGTVAEVYEKIAKDIEEGLPLIDDNAYIVAPKYHFNRRASYALASRFYLYYGNYDKAIEYSNVALAGDLEKILRNMKIFPTLVNDVATYCREWINPLNECTYLIMPAYSGTTVFLNYTTGKLYQHSLFIAENETVRSKGPWNPNAFVANDWYHKSGLYTSSGYIVYPKVLYLFEYTDPIAGTGYARGIYPIFTSDEVLLNRAEAYIVKGQYDLATADLGKWMTNHFTTGVVLTREMINSYYGEMPYYLPDDPTPKKHLNPLNFSITSAEQENFLQCLLHFRRIETLYYGLRWFDIKRFGIVIWRRDLTYASDKGDAFEKVTDILELDDPRRAMQLPSDVISAGLPANPRK
ncbi:MAG: RagB/SusD family nutrient uptake outer membrane protein [Tannerella sp.]|nr:RagB/SusD family nutrient uptake outer membrane protein [Tannerella sp.]